LDPVRFLTNDSTGVMGDALVREAKAKGHRVTSVHCPWDVESARELEKKLKALLPSCDVLIMAAAVCDARPATVSKKKIGKDGLKVIRLVKNPDILARLSRHKKKDQFFVGFGIESEDILKRGFMKLQKKGLDIIVLQKVSDKDRPFGDKKIDAFILDRQAKVDRLPCISKKRLAGIIVSKILKLTSA
jgi:phosphopantothenoylcysteine decarboxylase/phosphopantothenate--cysteine ligase